MSPFHLFIHCLLSSEHLYEMAFLSTESFSELPHLHSAYDSTLEGSVFFLLLKFVIRHTHCTIHACIEMYPQLSFVTGGILKLQTVGQTCTEFLTQE